jgi:hypothetical protein
MGTSASLDADQAWLDVTKELQHRRSPQGTSHNNMSILSDGVNLEHRLGPIHPDRGNLLHQTVPSVLWRWHHHNRHPQCRFAGSFRTISLSFRDVEGLLAERGITVSYETVRRWVNFLGR